MGRHVKTRDDLVVRVLEWCGTYLEPLGLDEATIESAGGDPVAYLELLVEREAEFCGAQGSQDVVDDWGDDEDDLDMPVDFDGSF